MGDDRKMSDDEAEEAASQSTQEERDKWDKRTK